MPRSLAGHPVRVKGGEQGAMVSAMQRRQEVERHRDWIHGGVVTSGHRHNARAPIRFDDVEGELPALYGAALCPVGGAGDGGTTARLIEAAMIS